MSSFLKSLKKTAQSAAATVASPIEINLLDAIVESLLQDYDRFVAELSPPEPLTAEEAVVQEEAQFASINNRYDQRSHEKLGRNARDDQDLIAVRKRILNRGLSARKGKVYAKFAGEVDALTVRAATTLQQAVDSLKEFHDSILVTLPRRVDAIQDEFAVLRASIEDQVNQSFPGGVAGIDRYDDELPHGLPSWDQFQVQLRDARDAVLAQNATAVASALASARAELSETMSSHVDEKIREAVEAAIKAAAEEVRSEVSERQYPFLDSLEHQQFLDTLREQTNEYEVARLGSV